MSVTMRQLLTTSALLLLMLVMSGSLSIDGGYIQRSAEQGDVDVVLSCNMIQSSDAVWTLKSTEGYFIHIYVNRTITNFVNFLRSMSLVNSSSLRIYPPERQDSGLYNCYEASGRRVVGYNLTVIDPAPRHYYRTVKVGQTVRFPCPTKLPEDIYWARLGLVDGRKTEIYWGNFGPRDLGLNPRFKVMHNQSNSLVIHNVTVDDSANYQCIEDSGLGNEHFYLLNVQEMLVYRRVNVVVGDTVQLTCNTSQSRRIMWTYDNDTDDGYVHYVYWDGFADRPRLLTSSSKAGVHAIFITNAELTDSGLYDCYDGKGSRQVGYQLIVNETTMADGETEVVPEGTTPAAVTVPVVLVVIVITVIIGVIVRRRRRKLGSILPAMEKLVATSAAAFGSIFALSYVLPAPVGPGIVPLNFDAMIILCVLCLVLAVPLIRLTTYYAQVCTLLDGAELSLIMAVTTAVIANPSTNLALLLKDVALRFVFVFVVLTAAIETNVLFRSG